MTNDTVRDFGYFVWLASTPVPFKHNSFQGFGILRVIVFLNAMEIYELETSFLLKVMEFGGPHNLE
jgi:hypothetical protein